MTVTEFQESTSTKQREPAVQRDLLGNEDRPNQSRKKTKYEIQQENLRRETEKHRKKQAKRDRAAAKEFSGPPPVEHASNHETTFRHSAWAAKRRLVRAALLATGATSRALEAFDDCGACAVVEYCEDEQRYRVSAQHCKNRFCEPCMRAKANLMAANLRERLLTYKLGDARLLTLTIKHTDTPLKEQLTKLYADFSQLRKEKVWKNNVTGGMATLEVKWDPDTAEWHPHLHCIIEGDPMQKSRIADAWLRITGDSYVVDIKALNSSKDTAYYLSKYVSKGCNDAMWLNQNAAEEFVLAMKGRRTCMTFGTWRGFKLLKKPSDDRNWKRIGTLDYVVAQANEGHRWAIALIDLINRDLRYDPHKKRSKEKPPNDPALKEIPALQA